MQAWELVFRTLLGCQLFAGTYSYDTFLLGVWLLGANACDCQDSVAGSWLVLAALAAVYVVPLMLLYHGEVSRRMSYAARAVSPAEAQQLRATLTTEPIAPMSLLLATAMLACMLACCFFL